MTTQEAQNIRYNYYDLKNPSAADEFNYTEALGTLIEQTKHPRFMHELSWYYCCRKDFDVERKYLEMAAECGYGPAYEELGYMWYHGFHGEVDYGKSFEYFSKAAQPDCYGNHGSLWARYKLADMYRFGCHVPKDEAKYCEMIEAACEDVDADDPYEPFPEIALRLAGIRAAQGSCDEALTLLRRARDLLAERLSYDPFWGNIEVMGRIVRFQYELASGIASADASTVPSSVAPATATSASAASTTAPQAAPARPYDIYDLFQLTQQPGRFRLTCAGEELELESVLEDGEPVIHFSGKWYRSFEDFLQKATIQNQRVTAIYDEIYDIAPAD